MTEGPWDGSDLPPDAVRHPTPPREGGGGGGAVPPHQPKLDARDKGDAEGLLRHWPWTGIKPGLGGWDL